MKKYLLLLTFIFACQLAGPASNAGLTGFEGKPKTVKLKITGMTFPESQPAPLFAEHTEEICRQILQLSEDEIRGLVDEEVLEVARLEP